MWRASRVAAWFAAVNEVDRLAAWLMPLVFLFKAAVLVGPLIIVIAWDHPPLVVGVAAALFGFGVIVSMLDEGFAARTLAMASSGADRSGEMHTRSWALVIRAILGTAWLVPVVGVWSGAFEHHVSPSTALASSDYAVLALWHAADVVPVLNITRSLGYSEPPVAAWGIGTGIALLALGVVVLYSIVLVITELLTHRPYRNRESSTTPGMPGRIDLP